MAQFYPDDSDCFIEEQNITCINLDDSEAEIYAGPPRPSDQDVEEGEVLENESINTQKAAICEIKFSNKKQFELFGPLIINSIKETLNNQLNKNLVIDREDTENYVKLKIKEQFENAIEEIPLPSIINTALNNEDKCRTFDKELSPDLTGIKELFTIDTEPAAKIDSINVPSYKRAIKETLLDEEATARKKQKEKIAAFKMKKTSNCFNCGQSDHNIRECPKPHNAKRVKNARKACYKTERYHVDIEQRFADIKPGCISNKLREALGLRKGELPFFFYRMRVLGYPPGWLEDAKVEHSGINLFNSDGNKILHSNEDEGEIESINHKYNISKIYGFPGFNEDPGKNFFDDYKYHNVPPLNKIQMKEEFIKALGDSVLTGYKRKKLKDFPNVSSDDSTNNTIHEPTDMEIEDPETTISSDIQFARPPPPVDQPPSFLPPPPPPTFSPMSCESPMKASERGEHKLSAQSPSLNELEKQKQRLLQELKANTSTIELEDSLIDDIIELDEEASEDCELSKTTDKNLENSSKSTEVATNDTVEHKTTVIKESFMGTPVLKFSPYNNLPNGENFKVGVSDVINFENLPDSTGKYEQMKEVIKKVRVCITKLHSDE